MINYTQCKLQREDLISVAYIPSKFAILDKTIHINDIAWKVIETYDTKSDEYIKSHENDYKKQRRMSDI